MEGCALSLQTPRTFSKRNCQRPPASRLLRFAICAVSHQLLAARNPSLSFRLSENCERPSAAAGASRNPLAKRPGFTAPCAFREKRRLSSTRRGGLRVAAVPRKTSRRLSPRPKTLDLGQKTQGLLTAAFPSVVSSLQLASAPATQSPPSSALATPLRAKSEADGRKECLHACMPDQRRRRRETPLSVVFVCQSISSQSISQSVQKTCKAARFHQTAWAASFTAE